MLSTPSVRRATESQGESIAQMQISIHALREEGDLGNMMQILQQFTISIHALREEGDKNLTARTPRHTGFLSTPSARRATGKKTGWE